MSNVLEHVIGLALCGIGGTIAVLSLAAIALAKIRGLL